MADFEQQLSSILSNPQLMNQLFSMAGALGSPPQQQPQPRNPAGPDPATLQQLFSVMKQTRPEPREQALLNALSAYLPADRVQKLSRAMQAARIAKFASTALSGSDRKGG